MHARVSPRAEYNTGIDKDSIESEERPYPRMNNALVAKRVSAQHLYMSTMRLVKGPGSCLHRIP
jgi:hypothetical protein